MSDKNKALIRRYLDALAQGDMALVDELLVPHHTCDFGGIQTNNREEYKQFLGSFATAFPDLNVTIEEQVTEGDKEVHRWIGRATHLGDFMGVPATGKTVEFNAMFMSKIVDGKIVAEWGLMDVLTIMQQIGAVPTPG